MTLKHDIRPIIIHVLIPWNKVTLYCQIVPMCGRSKRCKRGPRGISEQSRTHSLTAPLLLRFMADDLRGAVTIPLLNQRRVSVVNKMQH